MQLITKCWRIAITYRRLLRLIEMSLYCSVKPTTVRSIALPPPTLPVVHSTKGWVEVELLMKHSQTIFWWWWYLQCVPEKLKTTLCQGWICFVRYFTSTLGQQNKPLTQYWHTEIMKKLRVTCDKKSCLSLQQNACRYTLLTQLRHPWNRMPEHVHDVFVYVCVHSLALMEVSVYDCAQLHSWINTGICGSS